MNRPDTDFDRSGRGWFSMYGSHAIGRTGRGDKKEEAEVWRTIFTIGVSLMLSMAFLAACNGDDTDNGIADDPAGIADDSDGDEVPADDALTEEDDDAVGEDPDETPMATDDDAVTDDDDEAVVDDDDDGVSDDDDAVADDDEMAAGDTFEVTLSDHEIDMETTFEAGTVILEVTNEGEVPHGIAIEEVVSSNDDDAVNDDDDDAALDDDDDDAVTNDDDDDNGEAETGELIAATTVDPGETTELEVELQEGEYIVFCPIAEHRTEEGMEEQITVE